MRNKLILIFSLSAFISFILSCDNQKTPSEPKKNLNELPVEKLAVVKADNIIDEHTNSFDKTYEASDFSDKLDHEASGPNTKSIRGMKATQSGLRNKKNKNKNSALTLNKDESSPLTKKVKDAGSKIKFTLTDTLHSSTNYLRTKLARNKTEEQVGKCNVKGKKSPDNQYAAGSGAAINTDNKSNLGKRPKSADFFSDKGKSRLAPRSSSNTKMYKMYNGEEWRDISSVPTRVRPRVSQFVEASAPPLELLYASNRGRNTMEGDTISVSGSIETAPAPSRVGSVDSFPTITLRKLIKEKENDDLDEYEIVPEDITNDTASSKFSTSSNYLEEETDEEVVNDDDDKTDKKTSEGKKSVVKKFLGKIQSATVWLTK
jgi:hypothetical protein